MAKKVRCTETGRGSKGSVFVCWTPKGDIVLKARKVAPYKYDIVSEYPLGRFKVTMYAPNRRDLRKRIEEWLEHLMR
ncbi:MAG: hypothetical protein DRN90_00240 [Thermoproteota archaeon]|nr:MAG: hypothetical protein DRN90_00240 [Candidatus Korarchaeota archaeon]